MCRSTGLTIARSVSEERISGFTDAHENQSSQTTTMSCKKTAALPEQFTADLWADIIHLQGAQVLAEFAEDFYSGCPAITVHRYGRGLAVYVGTRPEEPVIAHLLQVLTSAAGVKPVMEVPFGVEAACRQTEDGRRYWFLLNHTKQVQRISLPPKADGGYRNLLTDKVVKDELVLKPHDVAVLRTEAAQ
jgi:beta-galactosidase